MYASRSPTLSKAEGLNFTERCCLLVSQICLRKVRIVIIQIWTWCLEAYLICALQTILNHVWSQLKTLLHHENGMIHLFPMLTYEGRLCIPASLADMRQAIIYELHDSPISGHTGRTKLYLNLRDRFYWPCLESDVRKYTSSSDECQRSKVKQ